MKILIVSPHYFPEGFTVTNVAEGLAAKGHDVLVVTNHPNYGFGRILEGYEDIHDEVINGVRVHRVKVFPRQDGRMSIIKNYLSFWKNSKAYARALKEKFDVVYSVTLSPVIAASAANVYAKKHHVPHILHCLDLWPESTVVTGAVKKGSLLYKVLYRWSKSIYTKTDRILVSSPSFESYFREELKMKDHSIVYVPQPALLAKQQGEDVSYGHLFNLVYAGNIGTLQLVENLVKAIPLVKGNYDVQLHLIGMGAREKAVKQLIQENGLKDLVVFYGTKPRAVTQTYFANCTGIVVSLKNDGTVGKTIPNKLTSSLACSKPIFAVIEGDGRKVLEEAKGSVFAEGETPEQIALAMKKLFDLSEEERELLGANNRRYFEDNYAFERVLEQIENQLKC